MRFVFQKLFSSRAGNLLSIRELKDLKVLEKKIMMSKNFRQYVSDLNRKQSKWLENR